MARQLPSLNALRAFEAAARHLSFTGAATELHVSQSAISRHVKLLEDKLGRRLFLRGHNSLRLTNDGAALLPVISNAFDRMAHATETVTRRRRDLRLRVLPSFATRWLIPRLICFETEREDFHIRLTTSSRVGGFRLDEFEAWIAYGDGRWPDLKSDLLWEEVLVPVCAPALCAGPAGLRTPDDLRHVQLLHTSLNHLEWRTWAELLGLSDLDPDDGMDFDLFEPALHAALGGYGVALLDRIFVADDLTTGRLVVPFEVDGPALGSYFLVFPPSMTNHPTFEVFRDWLLAEAESTRTSVPIAAS